MLDGVERLMRAYDAESGNDAKASWRKEIDFELAKILATVAIYAERGKSAPSQVGQNVDLALKWVKRGKGISALVKWIQDLLTS